MRRGLKKLKTQQIHSIDVVHGTKAAVPNFEIISGKDLLLDFPAVTVVFKYRIKSLKGEN
jgi:hypothetical protein